MVPIMRISHGTVAAALLVLASACGNGEKPAARSSPSPSITGLVHPGQEQQDAFVKDLRSIAPSLVRNHDRAVRLGRNVCLDLANDSEKIALSHVIRSEDVDTKTAQRIVSAARSRFCPSQ